MLASAVLQQNKNLTRLHIMNTTVDELNMNLFWLSNLESLAFTDGRVARVMRLNHTNTNLTNLKCLNLSNNHITDVDSGIAREIPSLIQLDLSNNNITNFSFELPENGSNNLDSHFWLDISSKYCKLVMKQNTKPKDEIKVLLEKSQSPNSHMAVTRILVLGIVVNRSAVKRRSTVNAPPSVSYPFQKCPQ
jgi:Leucine-rich repeat (LRR) protein